MITSINPPPETSVSEYAIFSVEDLVIDLSDPGFVQEPNCGFRLIEEISWSIAEDAPIVQDTEDNTN